MEFRRLSGGFATIFTIDDWRVDNATRKDLSNFTQMVRCRELNGRAPIEWLMDELKNNSNYWTATGTDENCHIKRLLIAPKSGIELWKQFPQVLLMDATYKTNRFNTPLFNIVGANSTKRTFQIVAVFISDERTETFGWTFAQLLVLRNIYGVAMPNVMISDRELALINGIKQHQEFNEIAHIICQWHVFMNVLAKTKFHFPKARKVAGKTQRDGGFARFLHEFKKLMHSDSEKEYQQEWNEFSKRENIQKTLSIIYGRIGVFLI